MHMGVLRTGSDEDNQIWFQITQTGQQLLLGDTLSEEIDETAIEKRIFIVQPNFEIVITANNAAILSDLALLCDLKEGGTLRVYRMTESSIQRGLAARKTANQWIEFLNRFSQTPVPGNVERTLREWERRGNALKESEQESLSS
jgi:hypothetical protein